MLVEVRMAETVYQLIPIIVICFIKLCTTNAKPTVWVAVDVGVAMDLVLEVWLRDTCGCTMNSSK